MVDFKEVTKKDGTRLVFCNFEELLMDFYGVSTFDEVEPHVNNNGEYIIHCPFCKEEGHTKHKLYIKSDLTVGHCFVCTRSYVHVTNEIDTSFRVPDFLSRFNFFPGHLNLIPLTDPTWSLDKYYNEFDNYSDKGYNYLVNRNPFLSELYKILDFKFMDGNIVMPFKYHGNIFYYQVRFTGNSKIRYYFPPISQKPPYIIEHGDNKKFIIVEGVYDAISCLIQAPDYTPFAVLGSSVSDYQLEFLREYAPIEEIIVYMDDTEKSKGIARRIKSVIDYCPIRIIKSNGEDPEERMNRYLKSGKKLDWIKPINKDTSGIVTTIPEFNWNIK